MLFRSDLSDPSFLSAEVNWWMIMDIENGNFDYLYVEVSTDNFATYTEIASFFGEDMLDPWVEYSYSLGAFLGNDNVKVRFHFSSDGGYEVDGCYIDDFSIVTSDFDNAAPEVFFDEPFAYEGSIDDYIVVAEIIDASGVESAEIIYTVDGTVQNNIVGENTNGDTWEFTIPQQEPGYQIDFVITALDVSPISNEVITDTASYIAGNYIGYDNGQVDFFSEVGPASTGGVMGIAVSFTLEEPTQLVTALIRNYTDQSVGPNDEMLVHIWSDGGNGPGVDLMDPITIVPEANLINTMAFTRIDLKPFASQLSNLSGEVFIGFTVPNGVVRTTITQPGIANRSWNSPDGTSWSIISDDFHFRIITGESTLAPSDLTAEQIDEDIILQWNAPEESSKSGKELLGYNVYYGFNSATPEVIDYIPDVLFTHENAAILGLHTYYVKAVYDGGESAPSNEVEVLITSIGNHKANNIQVYPNPAKDVVTINSGIEIRQVCLYDYTGKLVLNEVADNEIIQVNVSNYIPGIYLLKLEVLDGSIMEMKLIIK